tara:strand:+ start:147 stop:1085 length:939 start_codon:yes stop_codon:yes gene_type:complete
MYKILGKMNSSIINFHKNNKQGENITSFRTPEFQVWEDADVFKYISTIDDPENTSEVIKETRSHALKNQLVQLQTGDIKQYIDNLMEHDSLPQFFQEGDCLLSLSDLFDFKLLKFGELADEIEDEMKDTSGFDQLQMGWKDRETITIVDSKNRTSDQIYFDQRARVIESVIESHKGNLTDEQLYVGSTFIKQVLHKTDLPKTINFYNEKNADLLFVAFSITQQESWTREGPIKNEEFDYCFYFTGKCDLEHCRICDRILFLIKFTSSKKSRDAIAVAKLYVTMMRNSIQTQDVDETLDHEGEDSEDDTAGFV